MSEDAKRHLGLVESATRLIAELRTQNDPTAPFLTLVLAKLEQLPVPGNTMFGGYSEYELAAARRDQFFLSQQDGTLVLRIIALRLSGEHSQGLQFHLARDSYLGPAASSAPKSVTAEALFALLTQAYESDRFVLIGMSASSRVLFVVHAERGERIRLISVRRASPTQRRLYEKGF